MCEKECGLPVTRADGSRGVRWVWIVSDTIVTVPTAFLPQEEGFKSLSVPWEFGVGDPGSRVWSEVRGGVVVGPEVGRCHLVEVKEDILVGRGSDLLLFPPGR